MTIAIFNETTQRIAATANAERLLRRKRWRNREKLHKENETLFEAEEIKN